MMDYNHHIGYVDKVDRMANSYSISCQAWKCEKICFSSDETGHSEQLHPFFFMWWEENLMQRFLTRPSENTLAVAGQEQRLERPIRRPPTTSGIAQD
jgi:hypothetical protein